MNFSIDEPFRSFYPTTSSSLSQHFSVRLLWLPLQCCIKMVSHTGKTSASSHLSSTRSTLTIGTTTTFYDEDDTNGFELRLRNYFVEHNQVSVQCSEKRCTIQFFIGSQLSASQWQNIDNFRRTRAVVIVLNCAILPCLLQDAVHYVQSVFDANFGDHTCRCIVLNPPKEQQLTISQNFILVHSEESVEQIAQRVLRDIAQSISSTLDKIVHVASSEGFSGMTIRTPLDTGNSSSISPQSISSRHHKMKGDVLLQLGRLDEALESYSLAYFSSKTDPLWRSASLECIAAARYLKMKDLFAILNDSTEAVIDLQSETVVFDANMLSAIDKLEKQMKKTLDEYLNDIRRMKKVLPYPLYHYLRHELYGTMSDALTSLTKAAVLIQDAASLDSHRSTLSKRIRDAIKKFIICVNSGIDGFLKESLTQLKRASELSHVSLADRELDTHLKWAYFFSITKRKVEFFVELNAMWRLALSMQEREETIRRVMMYGVMMCAHCGCRKSAVSLLIQIAVWERERQCHHLSVEALVYACTLCGLNLPCAAELAEVPALLTEASVSLTRSSVSDDEMDEPKCKHLALASFEHDESLNRLSPNSVFELRLLDELIESMEKAGIRFGILCRISVYVLFRYTSLLSSASQEKLMKYAEIDASQVPFLAIEESFFPFFLSYEPCALSPHLAPKTIAICGPLFTYIDTQRLQLTVLCLNGKRLDSNVVWVLGEVAKVEVRLTNPFKHWISFSCISLLCSAVEKNDTNNKSIDIYLKSDPIRYAAGDVGLEPGETKNVFLEVMPQMEGAIRLEGIECQLQYMGSTMVRVKFASSLEVPVVQQLPQLSCNISIPRVKMFSGQEAIPFSLTVSNCGYVAVDEIRVSMHNEVCQLEDCKGCCETESKKDLFVLLDKTPISHRIPLRVSESFTMCGFLHSPMQVCSSRTYFPLVRLDYWVKYPDVSAPADIPSAIPVFGVVPRRVKEIRWPITIEAGIEIKGLELSPNRRSCSIRLANRSQAYSICVFFSAVSFLGLGDAVISPSSEYTTPFVEIAEIKKYKSIWKCVPVRWSEASSRASGNLLLDFSELDVLADDQILHQCILTASISVRDGNHGRAVMTWSSANTASSCSSLHSTEWRPLDIISIPLSKVTILLDVQAPWSFSKKVWISSSLSVDDSMGTLSGPINCCVLLGGSNDTFSTTFEFMPYVSGDVVLRVSLRDADGDFVYHRIYLRVDQARGGE